MSENRLCLRLQRGCGMRAGGVMFPCPFRGRALFSLLPRRVVPYVLTWDDNTHGVHGFGPRGFASYREALMRVRAPETTPATLSGAYELGRLATGALTLLRRGRRAAPRRAGRAWRSLGDGGRRRGARVSGEITGEAWRWPMNPDLAQSLQAAVVGAR
jgi:hypothetical protein